MRTEIADALFILCGLHFRSNLLNIKDVAEEKGRHRAMDSLMMKLLSEPQRLPPEKIVEVQEQAD